MTRLLAGDTSTGVMTLALCEGDAAVAQRALTAQREHSTRIVPLVLELLAEAGWGWGALDGLVVGLGPGSFTGVRIAVSTFKGFAYAAGRPLVGVSSLDALAAAARGGDSATDARAVCAAIDARKGEVYAALWPAGAAPDGAMGDGPRAGAGGAPREAEPEALRPEVLVERLLARPEPLHLVGDGVTRHRELFERALGDRATFGGEGADHPSAPTLARLGAARLRAGRVDDVLALEPLYVRPSDAELGRPRPPVA